MKVEDFNMEHARKLDLVFVGGQLLVILSTLFFRTEWSPYVVAAATLAIHISTLGRLRSAHRFDKDGDAAYERAMKTNADTLELLAKMRAIAERTPQGIPVTRRGEIV